MKFVCFGKKIENLEIAIRALTVGAKKPHFLKQLKHNDEILLYCDGKIYATALIVGEGFVSKAQIWNDYEYEYRFNMTGVKILKSPYLLKGSPLHSEFSRTFGRGWAFKVLFTPQALSHEICNIIKLEIRRHEQIQGSTQNGN